MAGASRKYALLLLLDVWLPGGKVRDSIKRDSKIVKENDIKSRPKKANTSWDCEHHSSGEVGTNALQ